MAASCGAPGGQPRNPPRDVGPEILVLSPKTLSKHRLLVRQDKRMEGEPHLIAKMPDHDLWMTFFRDSENNFLGLMSEVTNCLVPE